uniref:Tail tube protein n=1 Tax=Siphoviridae sp. ct7EW56 TaxID=2827562 RepID=A0A8S5LRL7_9CAUD|nr:MAG TPA: tail tube protein [Siphoviridae sp. ct7EW56]
MATGLKSRIAYKVPSGSPTAGEYWAGTYKLLARAKSIPTPIGDANMVDASTLEDTMEVQEFGRRSANQMDIPCAFEKKYKDELIENEGKNLDIIILYGTDGKGSEGICAFIGQETFAPGEATDDHLEGTVTISQKTVPKWIEDDYDVAVTEDEQGYPTAITLTKKS